MARVRLVQKEQAPPEVSEVFQKIESNGARIINLYRVAANSPDLLLNFIRLANSIVGRMELPARLRELIILRVAKLTACEYEWAQHTSGVAQESGLTQKQIDLIPDWRDSAEFSVEERAVLQYVDEVANNVKVTDPTFNVLKSFFNDRAIVEITLTIGFYGMLARLLVPLQVEVDKGVGSASELAGHRPKK